MFIEPTLSFKYVPILSLSPSEMLALAELPNKDKDLILPLIPLKGWMSAKDLSASVDRVEKTIGMRQWIADIDVKFLEGAVKFPLTGEYPRRVYYEIRDLLDSSDGYENWFQFLLVHPNAIPVAQLEDIEQLALQLQKLSSLGRGVVVRLVINSIGSYEFDRILKELVGAGLKDLYILFDYGDVKGESLSYVNQYFLLIETYFKKLPNALFSATCTSFPYSFSGSYKGEISIYERLIYQKIKAINSDLRLVYSDYGSTRAGKMSGGSGTPPPRIDYPLKNDWRFVRKEFADPKNIEEGEKARIYSDIAREIILSDYWLQDLYLWGTQMITLTSKSDDFGISTPVKATAVRINIHLYKQLHYDAEIESLCTDEDWED